MEKPSRDFNPRLMWWLQLVRADGGGIGFLWQRKGLDHAGNDQMTTWRLTEVHHWN